MGEFFSFKLNCILLQIFLFFCLPFNSYSQNESLKFEHLTTEQGLCQINVNCIKQDSRGFIWIGTRNGLNRYDGYKFITYRNDPADNASISNNTINDMIEDKEGNIWFATQSGLDRYNRRTAKFTRFVHNDANSNTLCGNVITRLSFDAEGKLWIASQTGGLDCFNPRTQRFEHHPHVAGNNNTVGDNNVRTVFTDSHNNIWAGTFSAGLFMKRKNTSVFVKVRLDTKLKNVLVNNITVIFEDDQKSIWVGTQENGLFHLDGQGDIQYFHDEKQPYSISSNTIYSLNNDTEGNLWVGTENGGVCIYDKRTARFNRYLHDDVDNNSLDGNSIYGICKDRMGNMWLGAFGGGVNVFKKSTAKFSLYRHNASPESLTSNFVLDITQDKAKNIWLGTDGGGLNKFDPLSGKFKSYKKAAESKDGIAGNYILVAREHPDGNIWIGTWGDGLSVLNPQTGKFKNFKHDINNPNSVANNDIYYLIHTKDQNTWLSPFGTGLDYYDHKTGVFKHYRANKNDSHGLGSDWIYSLCEDRRGNLWIGTCEGGLELMDRKTNTFTYFKHSDNSNSVSNNGITEIFEDSKGRLWLGTLSGLNMFDTQTRHFTNYYKKDGLPSDIIYAIREDNQGILWISTNSGISRFDTKTGKFKNYTTEDGVQGEEFKPHSALKAYGGKLYFGGVNGFNVFSPQHIVDANEFAPLVITSFSVFNKPLTVSQDSENPSPLKQDIADTRSITLSYKQSVFSFEFASLDYSAVNKKQYAYKLENFDKEWMVVDGKNTAAYTNLSPGTYQVRLKYKNNAGKWSPVSSPLKITIVPPFWLTWWFEALSVIVIAGSIFGLFRYRVSLIKEQKNALEQQVKERTERLARLTIEERQSREAAEKAKEEAESAKEEANRAKEEAEIAKVEADKANKAKSIFLATMSHEIRTPMNGVVGMAALLSSTKLTTEQEEYINTIKNSGDALINVINDILDFTKIETGNVEIEETEFNLSECVEKVLDVFTEKLSHMNIDLLYEIAADISETVIGDPLRLRQVLINLVGNAFKFTTTGEIFIDVKTAKKFDNKFELLFTIKDTGIGISEDKIHTLFTAFSQVDSSTTRKYGGTGLGLAISEKLVQLMGGDINVTSEIGKGSTFYFTVVARSGVTSSIHVSPLNDRVRKTTTLVVDDNATSRSILQQMLMKHHLQTIVAMSGRDALQVLDQDSLINLVVMDMNMPEMDGVETAEIIRLKFPLLPIILLSSARSERAKSANHLFKAILTKPVKHHVLYTHVINALDDSETQSRPTINASHFSADTAAKFPLEILVAEDNAINQKVILQTLKKLGYQADLAATGKEVIDVIAHKQYDMILMDVQMPEMDGLQATRYIRDHATYQPVIVAMTANAMAEDREICITAGMNDYLSKPIKIEEMIAVLAKWSKVGSNVEI
jgi:signal transduction histidine kinase/CheY-like chemotaxis protein/ligand-binding sensor domain-containing protein